MTHLRDLRAGCAVITGGGSGIGAALAQRTAVSLSIPVAVLDLSTERAVRAAAAITNAGGVAYAWALDVTDAAAMHRAAAEITTTLGSPSLLVANAGIEHSGAVWLIPPEQWRRVQDVNVNGVFNTIRAFVPSMIEAGRRSHVVCLASIGGLAIRPAMSAYIVSKHAVLALSESLALDLGLAEADIGVSAVLPGPVATRIATDALVTPSAEAESARRRLEHLLNAEGLEPDAIAELILSGVDADLPWIFTHPALAAATVAERTGRLETALRVGARRA